jgi:RNA polymerase sigma factor (sigma-70 family)
VLAVHEALEEFAKREPQKAELVKLRYFVGMTVEEAAAVLGISVGTAKRHWAYARAWLYEEISGGGS